VGLEHVASFSVGDDQAEISMRIVIALATTLVAIAAPAAIAASSDSTAPSHHHHHRRHAPQTRGPSAPATEPIAPARQEPVVGPYPPGQGDTDGLSRDPEDCDKGCIGGNPS